MPKKMSLTETLVNDTGASATDDITSVDTLTGHATGRSVVTFSIGTQVIGTTTASPSGSYTFTPRLPGGTHLPDGTYTVTATTNGGAATSLTFTLDTTRPAVTETLANDTAGNNTTTDPTLTGTAEPASNTSPGTVTLTEGGAVLGTATVGSTGTWTFVDPTPLSAGTHTVLASETDLAGNTGSASLTFTLQSGSGGGSSGGSGTLSGQVLLASAMEGAAIVAGSTIASFTDSNASDSAAGFSATINWGDNTTSPGTVGGGSGSFTVTGGHTYADEGSMPLSVSITRTADNTSIAPSGTVAVAESDALTGQGVTIAATAGQALSNATVASFTDTNAAALAGNFAATVDWGDGTASAGTVSGSNGSFTVTGGHTYANSGTDAVSVTLTDNAPGTATATASSTAQVASGGSGGGSGGVPAYSHVVVVVEENHDYSQIIGNSQAPYINSLAANGALLTNYDAITHPSEPNYFALYAGSTFGVTDDNNHPEQGPTLATVLQGANMQFLGYVEASGSDMNHNPWEYFPEGTTVEKDFSAFPTGNFSSLPAVSFVIPGVYDDMHNGTIAQGDSWLQTNIDSYAQWAKANNSLLIVTWDENDGTSDGNHVATILDGAHVVQGTYGAAYNHYNLLSTALAPFNLTGPNNAAGAAPFAVFG